MDLGQVLQLSRSSPKQSLRPAGSSTVTRVRLPKMPDCLTRVRRMGRRWEAVVPEHMGALVPINGGSTPPDLGDDC
jgi:hypothetical protein